MRIPLRPILPWSLRANIILTNVEYRIMLFGDVWGQSMHASVCCVCCVCACVCVCVVCCVCLHVCIWSTPRLSIRLHDKFETLRLSLKNLTHVYAHNKQTQFSNTKLFTSSDLHQDRMISMSLIVMSNSLFPPMLILCNGCMTTDKTSEAQIPRGNQK